MEPVDVLEEPVDLQRHLSPTSGRVRTVADTNGSAGRRSLRCPTPSRGQCPAGAAVSVLSSSGGTQGLEVGE